ncbi:MAG: iron uptake porin, partial [Prochlorothrix sp.]
MTKLFWKSLVVTPVILGAALVAGNASAQELSDAETLNQLNEYTSVGGDMGQLRSVNQLSDVRPTDWAYQAVRSLVERYNCVAGYPDGTFRGSRAMTRYEAAALVNACMDTVNDLIAAATADLVTKEDLAVLQRLQEEFQAELATLRGRVDSLEARTAELEANQFSTTTKLNGAAIFSLNDAFGDAADGNTVFGGRVRLNLETSFTGEDRLLTRLEAENIKNSSYFNTGKLEYGGSTGSVDGGAGSEVSVVLDAFFYQFPVGEKAEITVGPIGVGANNFVPTTVWGGG